MVPVRAGTGFSSTGGFSWGNITQPYLKSTQIFHCPSNTKTGPSYTYNTAMGSGGGMALAAVQSPAITPIVVDAVGTGGADSDSLAFVVTTGTPGSITGRYHAASGAVYDQNNNGIPYPNIHLDTAVFLFADGHVKSLHYGAGKATFPAVTSPFTSSQMMIPSNGLDYDGDGTAGTAAGYE
jgi:prepilin-type processing-associated H-X9-DG protein